VVSAVYSRVDGHFSLSSIRVSTASRSCSRAAVRLGAAFGAGLGLRAVVAAGFVGRVELLRMAKSGIEDLSLGRLAPRKE
jgi:hypothetical protein